MSYVTGALPHLKLRDLGAGERGMAVEGRADAFLMVGGSVGWQENW